jgi:hypothetical protein
MNREAVARELVALAKELTGSLETPEDVYKDFARGIAEILNGLKTEVGKASKGNASVDYLEEKVNVLQRRLTTLKKNLKAVERS